MKRLTAILLLLLLVGAAHAEWLPVKSNRLVNDYSGVLDMAQVQALEQRLVAFNDSTSNQIVVVITPTLEGDDENAVAQRIGQRWGVGQERFDNGVVILIKSKTENENWGAVAIATGYGVEGALPDLFCKRIIEDCMLGSLGDGEYYSAINAALNVIMPVIAGEYSYADYRRDQRREGIVALCVLLLIIVVAIVVVGVYAKKHPDQWNNLGGGGTFVGGPVGGSWSSHGGGFSMGGGFGGFGGGSFGGGGASGRF